MAAHCVNVKAIPHAVLQGLLMLPKSSSRTSYETTKTILSL